MKKRYSKISATSAMVHIDPEVRQALDYLISHASNQKGKEITYSHAIRAVLKSWAKISNQVEQAEKEGSIKRWMQ